jgi:eukaryotic-like serine/threonine-protein kinase
MSSMRSDSQDWEQLQELFHLAASASEDARERVLAEACSDAVMRQRVMTILIASDAGAEPRPERSEELNSRIGPYRLIRHLGTGGIGSVYLAERMVGGTPSRSALKVLAQHAAGPLFVERFHREQHILASLEHPNITRMLDGGLSDGGQPYLVMEYVNGTHLDAYCDSHQLSVEQRLELFLQVCDAVAYAHRNLIVHLDLKPSNILVTEEGVVKLLDFGTSKLIRPDSLLTTTVMATPAYASPEQLRNEPVTTACDVYSLGAILFELLSGQRPGGKASVAIMIERAMREQEPEKLSKAVTSEAAAHRRLSESRLRLQLSGDLATIVAKCLSPRPKDRYASLDSLTLDIQRFMNGRPILARPQTTFYRVSKFVRRNRGGVAATMLISVALLASLGYAEWRQRQALQEAQRAVRMQSFMYRLFKFANSNYTGKPAATVPEFLELGVKMLPDYIKDPTDLREAQMGLAESMYENGDLDGAQRVFAQTIASAKNAGDISAEAESEAFSGNIAYQKGPIKIGEMLTAHALELSRKPGVSPAVRAWSAIYYAWNRENNGFHTEENLRLLQFAVQESRDYHLTPHETAEALDNLGAGLDMHGRMDEAEAAYSQALRVYDQDPAALCDQSEIYGDLAFIKDKREQISESLRLYQRAYEGYKTCSGAGSRGALIEQDYLAGALIKLGRSKEAIPILEGSLPAWRKVAGSSADLGDPFYFLVQGYLATGRYPEAEKTAEKLVELQVGKVAATDRRFGIAHLFWARALVGQQRYQDALPHAEIADKLLSMQAYSVGAKKAASDAYLVLSDVQAKLAGKTSGTVK